MVSPPNAPEQWNYDRLPLEDDTVVPFDLYRSSIDVEGSDSPRGGPGAAIPCGAHIWAVDGSSGVLVQPGYKPCESGSRLSDLICNPDVAAPGPGNVRHDCGSARRFAITGASG